MTNVQNALAALTKAMEEDTNRMEGTSRVVSAFCLLSSEVGEYFGNQYASDCFCQDRANIEAGSYFSRFQYEDQILNFIREAVQEKIARDGKPASRFA